MEERIDEDYSGTPGTDSIAELFWGIRYIDDLMLRRVDESAAGTTFERWHPLTDAQFSVRAVLRDDAGVHERVNYSPYGVAEHHWGSDVDNDRSADFFDWLAIADQVAMGNVGIGEANYVAEMDLNRDGVLDSDDANAIVTGTALPSGWISASGAGHPGNVIGFDGYVFNPEIETYSVRFRWYDPALGRWLQRDVLEYPDGMNRYQYVLGRPAVLSDAGGLNPLSDLWTWLFGKGKDNSTRSSGPREEQDDMPYWEQGRGDALDRQLNKKLGTLDFNIPATTATQHNRDELFGALEALQSFIEMAECMWDCMVNEGTYAEEVAWALINGILAETLPISPQFDDDGNFEGFAFKEGELIDGMIKMNERGFDYVRSVAAQGYLDAKGGQAAKHVERFRSSSKAARKLQSKTNEFLTKLKDPAAKIGKANVAATAISGIAEGAIEASQQCQEQCQGCN